MNSTSSIKIDQPSTIGLLESMVKIDSTNPTLVPGGAGEMALARFLCGYFEEAGIETQLIEAAPGRPNLIARIRGDGSGKSLLLSGHLDTVSSDGMLDPYNPRIVNDRMYGRGTFDMKGGLAAGIAAMLYIHQHQIHLKGDLLFAAVSDEEYGSIGSEKLVENIKADGCILLEPTGLSTDASTFSEVMVAHGGYAWAEIVTKGVAAHGSRADLGLDAIVKMGAVLTGIAELGQRLREGKFFTSAQAGKTMHPSIHASIIKGGRELSSYPDRCTLSIERRLIPGETQQQVLEELEALIAAIAARDPAFHSSSRITFFREPWQAQGGRLLEALQGAFRLETGARLQSNIFPAWTDAALFETAGIPTVIFGPLGEGAHALVEWVELQSVMMCARVLTRMVLEFCC